jgi:hypothetical protein
MPGLSGSQVAYRWAIADEEPRGKTRADSTRSGYFLRDKVLVSLSGTKRVGVVQHSIRIDLNTGEEPHRCSFEFKGGSGYVPQPGHTVTVGHGSIANAIFSGRLLKIDRHSKRADDRRPVYRCEAVGHVFEMNTTRLSAGFHARSLTPAVIVRSLLAAPQPTLTTLGYTATVEDFPTIEEFSAAYDEDLSQTFGRLCRIVDASWHIDHNKVIRIYGSLNRFSGAGEVSTITASGTDEFDLLTQQTDLSRVYTTAMVLGAAQPIEADINTTYHKAMPLAAASILGRDIDDSDPYAVYLSPSYDFLVGNEARVADLGIQTPESHFRSGQVSVFLPASVQANTLTVVSANVSSVSPLYEQRWYTIGGQPTYVASVLGIYSATANSIAYSYFIPSSISGSLNVDVSAFETIGGMWNYTFNASDPVKHDYFPAGTQVRVLAQAVGTGLDNVTSLFGGTTRAIARVIRDERLSPLGAQAVADEAVERGHPDRWRTIEFSTRNRYVDIGRAVYVSITSLAESGANSFVGTFVAHDVSLTGFGALTDTKGPIRTVRAGAVRRPTMWQVLQGE